MKTTGVSSQQPTGVTDSKKPQKSEQKGKGQKEFKSVLEEKTSETGALRPLKEKTSESGAMRAIREHHQGDIAEKKELKRAQIGDKKEQKQAEKKEFKQFLGESKELKKGIHEKSVQEKSDSPKEEKEIKEEKEFTVPTPILMGPSTVQSRIATEKMSEQHSVLNIKEIESIVDRVQVGVNEKGLPEFNFELNTQNLGPMSLKVTHDKEGIKIQFVTQNASAQKTLENNIGDLTKVLADRGMNLAGANITTRSPSAQQTSSESGGEGGHDQGGSAGGGGRRRRVERKKSEDDEDYTI